VFVAAWFACTDDAPADEDGVLWTLSQADMNQANVGYHGAMNLSGESEEVRRISAVAFEGTIGEWPPVCVIAPRLAGRPLAQQAEYTLHATDVPLEACDNAREWLCRLRIPATMKAPLRATLQATGVEESIAVSDLDSLAILLTDRIRV
jgi:hypothetical protein